MRSVAISLVLAMLVGLGGCAGEMAELNRAAALLRDGRGGEARERYARLSESRDGEVRVRAALGAARASAWLHDDAGRRRWLELAVKDPEVPGVSDEAYFELAELLRAEGEQSSALGYYYRAAAGAQRDQHQAYLYNRAVQAIAAMGMRP